MGQIRFENQTVNYTLRKSKRVKRMRLAVYCDGSVTVTAPFYFQDNIVERFIREKASWLLSKIEFFKQYQGFPIISSKKDYHKYKDCAYNLVLEKIEQFNKIYQVSYNKINIKNQKTRWGSCSRKGNLNFNYKIALLSNELVDYIVVHELCHLKEFNHSKRFWALVEKTIPNYLELKNNLRKNRVTLRK